MLQTWITRAKTLVDSKNVLYVGVAFLLGIGLSFYFIERSMNSEGSLKNNLLGKSAVEDKVVSEESQVLGQSSNTSQIVVDISGAVKNPGIYKIDPSSRVGDALSAAGGVGENASIEFISKNLNLAQLVEDTQKIYVPFEWDLYQDEEYTIQPLVIKAVSNTTVSSSSSSTANTGTSSSSTATQTSSANTSGKINVNQATEAELDKLSGIGPAYAKRIIDNRSYKDYTELTSKSGIPKTTLEKIKNDITY